MFVNTSIRRFAERVVIVTGAGRGIGQAIALRFAAEGANVVVTGRTRPLLQGTCDMIRSIGASAWIHEGDITKVEDVDTLVEWATSRWGKVDVLVNNAAAYAASPFLEISEKDWNQVVLTNLTGTFLISQRVAHEMARRETGAIIIISSIVALAAEEGFASYNASKAGLLGLMRSMAIELARYKIRVNAVSPGWTDTPWVREVYAASLESLRKQFGRVPMGRLVHPEEVAAACAFLASDEASGVTGTNLLVDCGVTANSYIAETIPRIDQTDRTAALPDAVKEAIERDSDASIEDGA